MERVNISTDQDGQQKGDDDGSDENVTNGLVAVLFPIVFVSNLIQLKHDQRVDAGAYGQVERPNLLNEKPVCLADFMRA